ncbi:hypothetical protein AB0M05_29925 [Streptomyces violaceusniger]|uniref:hypothetical protein n=1 Tax=Streptomyces violaceusniger TaxID=68280 RepID=UPI00341BDF66
MRAVAARPVAKHSDRMTKREDLGVVRGSRATQQKEAAQQSAEDQVEQSQTHDH